ncbi:hypothetical protein BSM4216_2121 [Bacillus smithii]|nr:hypothetical protein BSM4216_2121 [Bacillus smithii]
MQESSDVPLVRCLGSYLFEGKADAHRIVKKLSKRLIIQLVKRFRR